MFKRPASQARRGLRAIAAQLRPGRKSFKINDIPEIEVFQGFTLSD